jgi:DNA gyrase subunit A
MERPDLSAAAPEIVAYIEALEQELASLREESTERRRGEQASASEAPLEPSEPPTTVNIVTISRRGVAKRTPRHHYIRQRRGGMGVFDLETNEDDAPAFLVAAEEEASLILVTNHARAFRVPVRQVPEVPVRARGEPLLEPFPLRPDEHLALVFADRGGSHLVLVSERGQVRRVASHYFGASLQPGTVLYDPKEGGPPAAACWSSGDNEIFLATRGGRAIRFAERQVPVRGCLGMRVDREDTIVGVAAVPADGGVFMVTAEGKGTVRLMEGFSANKSPGAGGKVGMKTDELVGAVTATPGTDIFLISELGKIIRFAMDEVPPKEGVVQGVNCMNLRADRCVDLAGSGGTA